MLKCQQFFGILTFISMINTISERLIARIFFICRYFSFYEQLKFRAQLSWAWKKFYTGFPQALEIMENLENYEKKFHAWKNHGIWKNPE